MTKILWGVLLLIDMIGPAVAGGGECEWGCGVPAPEMGEGALGMLLAAGAVYLIKRRER